MRPDGDRRHRPIRCHKPFTCCHAGRAKDALEAEGELTPLQQFVETEARDLTRASFGDFVRDLFSSIEHLVASAPLYAPQGC